MATATEPQEWKPEYDRWRHGGWYIDAYYPSGGCGCVSNNFEDKRWRIIDGKAASQGLSFDSRGDCAKAVKFGIDLAKEHAAPLLAAARNAVAHLWGKRTPEDQAVLDLLQAAITKATGA